MRINHNIAALNTYRQLNSASGAQSKSMEKLSSGLRINRAGDDAAGLAISEKMRGQIRGLDMASKNAQDGVSMIQTAEGALNETHDILQRMRELAVQAGNDSNTTEDRDEIQNEINQLTSEINRIGNTTEFNTKKLLNGEVGSKVTTGNKNILSDVSVTSPTAGDYTVAVTGGNKAILTSAAKDASDNAQTLNTTDTLDTLFVGDAPGNTAGFSGDESITFQQDGKTATVLITDTDTKKVGDLISDINAALKGSGMEASASWDDTNKQIVLSSTKGGTGYDISVTENNFETNVTFGLADDSTNAQAATDYSVSVTGTASGSATLAKEEGNVTVGSMTMGLKVGSVGSTTVKVESNSLDFQIGANTSQAMNVTINDMRASALGLTGTTADYNSTSGVTNGTTSVANERGLDVTTHDKATAAISIIDDAIQEVSQERSKLGSYQNRLDHTINNLGTSSENLTAAESRIRDVDYALAA